MYRGWVTNGSSAQRDIKSIRISDHLFYHLIDSDFLIFSRCVFYIAHLVDAGSDEIKINVALLCKQLGDFLAP